MSDYRSSVLSSAADIPEAQWNAVWPYPPESYNFYLCQERAGLEGFRFAYLVIYARDRVVLIAPLFTAAFNLAFALEGRLQRLLLRLQQFWPGFLKFQTLFCGSPVTSKGVIGIDPDNARNPELMAVFDRALVDFARQSRARLIELKDFMDADLEFLAPLRSMGYFMADSYPMMILDIDFASLDDYLSRLSYQTRKDLRRKIKRTKTLGGLDVRAVNNIDDCIDDLHQLYLNIYHKNAVHFEQLTKAFFSNFCQYMPEETIFFLYRVNGKLIGFNFCLVQNDALVDKYLGFDYEVSQEYELYYISFLNNIQWCLDNGKKSYVLGQGGYSTKSRLAARLIPLRALVRYVNPLITLFVRLFSRFLMPARSK